MQFTKSRVFAGFALLFVILSSASATQADDRKLTPEQLEALSKSGELPGDENERPKNLPDLTKGDPIGERVKWNTWQLGPTGIIGYMVGGLKGDQIEVTSVLTGSPAEGRLGWGDVILGVNGTRFGAGQNMGMLIGKQIIEAERPVNNGSLKLIVWRDKNFLARNGKKDIVTADIDDRLNKLSSDKTLYDWKPEDEQKKEVRSQNFKDFPIDSEIIEIAIQLDVFPEYSDTSPYDCPKAAKILENAWKVLEQKFKADKVRSGRQGAVAALALVASGKQEHRELVREWVRSSRSPWRPPTEEIGEKFKPDYKGYKGYQSWHYSFDGLDCAIYYDATRDDFVLPALRKYAIEAAMGQAGGGSWGHTFAFPSFNGGDLHGMNPGYGALNAAGNRCFTLVALAQKLGIKHPEIDDAVERARRFFGSYVDKGGVPYGHHGAAATDDSNGKNVGVAFALKLLGDKHGAKYFAQMSTHASFTRRGGHGNDYFWHYSPWAATLCGPQGTIATHRNLRWRFTLCRRFDGGFVIHSPTGGMQELRDPTGTFALHYSAPFKQTMWTGKDADESMFWTEKQFDHLMTSALPQLNDPSLIKLAGKPYAERTTDELFKQLDMFKPKARGQYARELGKRYLAGEKEILLRLAGLLESDEPRLRDSGCLGLAACGPDATLQYMSKVARLLRDPNEFVRMQAARTMTNASDSDETQLALLKAIDSNEGQYAMSPNSLRGLTQNLFKGESDLARSPFDAGFDEALVRSALEKVIDLDPAGNRPFLNTRKGVWSKDTVARLAGPLVFAAEEEQIADQMFSARRTAATAVLEQLGHREYFESTASYLLKWNNLPRHVRPTVTFKRGLVDADAIKKNPAAFREFLDPLKMWIADDPLAKVTKKVGEKVVTTNVSELISLIAATTKPAAAPSLAAEAQRLFNTELADTDGTSAKIKLCRAELKDVARKNYFRKMAAMTYLAEHFGADAVFDLSPYLGHENWRLRQHSQKLAVRVSGSGGLYKLIEILSIANNTKTDSAVGVLEVLAAINSKAALDVVRESLQHKNAAVRQAAVQTFFSLGGDDVLQDVLTFWQEAKTPEDLRGCEHALLSRRDDETHKAQVRAAALAMLAYSEGDLRHSVYWVLAQLGGPESLAALQRASDSASDAEYTEIVKALSYSPDAAADQLLLTLIKENADTPRAQIAAGQGLRRLVIGPKGIATRSDKEILDFAEPLLKMVRYDSVVRYLGMVHTGRSAQVLQRCMRLGGVTNTAAEAIIACTRGMDKAPAKDKKLAAAALVDAIEFIEVRYLRGGVAAALKKRKEEQGAYLQWKSLSAQAGKNLLKLDKPGKAPLPEFNDLDLDF